MPPDTALTFSCAMRVVASVKKPDILFNSLRIKPDQAATSVAATPELPRSGRRKQPVAEIAVKRLPEGPAQSAGRPRHGRQRRDFRLNRISRGGHFVLQLAGDTARCVHTSF